MIESFLRVRDDLVADSASSNMLLTTMLRAELGRPVWGNWKPRRDRTPLHLLLPALDDWGPRQADYDAASAA